jgi:ferredoxin-nitrate reductase
MLDFIKKDTIEVFWISGTNSPVRLPNLPRVRPLLTKPNLFVVCQDIFMSETCQIADFVLPAAQWAEMTGYFTNADQTVHISHKAVEPPGEAKFVFALHRKCGSVTNKCNRPDLSIFLDYVKRMNFKDKDGNPLLPFKSFEEVSKNRRRFPKADPAVIVV